MTDQDSQIEAVLTTPPIPEITDLPQEKHFTNPSDASFWGQGRCQVLRWLWKTFIVVLVLFPMAKHVQILMNALMTLPIIVEIQLATILMVDFTVHVPMVALWCKLSHHISNFQIALLAKNHFVQVEWGNIWRYRRFSLCMLWWQWILFWLWRQLWEWKLFKGLAWAWSRLYNFTLYSGRLWHECTLEPDLSASKRFYWKYVTSVIRNRNSDTWLISDCWWIQRSDARCWYWRWIYFLKRNFGLNNKNYLKRNPLNEPFKRNPEKSEILQNKFSSLWRMQVRWTLMWCALMVLFWCRICFVFGTWY